MVFALLALLGVDLIVIAVLVLAQIGRRRWLARRGAFPARVWLVQGNSDELSEKKKMGRARWIKNVLVFSRAPFFLSNNILLIEGVQGVPRPAVPGEVKRLGSDPVILLLVTDGVTVALAPLASMDRTLSLRSRRWRTGDGRLDPRVRQVTKGSFDKSWKVGGIERVDF